MTDAKRQQLKEKIEQGEARLQERTDDLAKRLGEARDSAVDFAKEHPLLVIAGGVAAGVAISMMFRRSPTRKAADKAASKISGLAILAAELALPFIHQAMSSASEAGREGLDRLEDFGASAGEAARSVRRDAVERAGSALESAREATRGAGKLAGKALRSGIH